MKRYGNIVMIGSAVGATAAARQVHGSLTTERIEHVHILAGFELGELGRMIGMKDGKD